MTLPAPFVFVVGCGRSGTTMLRAMLDAHPLMAVPPESYFVARMARQQQVYRRGNGFDLPRFVSDLSDDQWYRRWGLGKEALSTALQPAPGELAEALRSVFRAYAAANGKVRYADKTPSYVRHIALLGALFPEARFLHLIRDGRDVALSFQRVPFGPDSLTEAALFWRSRTLTGREQGTALGPDRYCEIHYESLVDAPEAELQRLSGFLQLPYDPMMLRYNEHAERLMATGVPGAHERLASPPAAASRTWRDRLTADQVRRFELVAGDALTSFGYELAHPPASSRTRILALAGARTRAYGVAARRYVERRVKRRS